MIMKIMKHTGLFMLALLALASCTRTLEEHMPDLSRNELIIGGVTAPGITSISSIVTKASALDVADIDSLSWIRNSLREGLNIKYWWVEDESTKRNATLKLQWDGDPGHDYERDENGFPKYAFRYTSDGLKTRWYGNGSHFFQATLPAPELTQSLPADITTDQSGTNYTLLSRYLALGPQCKKNASVSRVVLPLRHRLSRVEMYILIDPGLSYHGATPTIEGYDTSSGKDDPTTSGIRVSSLDVLQSVDVIDHGAEGKTYSPVWVHEDHKIIPHSVGEKGSVDTLGVEIIPDDCIVYYEPVKKIYVTPSNRRWSKIHSGELPGYEAIHYGKVPVYDFTLRPTYTAVDSVMYDEPDVELLASTIATRKNPFNVEVKLNSGITQKATVTVDLNANYQAAVYVLVNAESVDTDTSLLGQWVQDTSDDGYYGVNNQLGHSLSPTGSSWQRAYRIGAVSGDKVTDGDYYNENTSTDTNTEGQYLSEATWLDKFATAYEGGACHGDYFILENDITIDTSSLPADFIFTGHLDAQDHVITLTGSKTWLFDGLDATYVTAQETNPSLDPLLWEANVHHEQTYWVPMPGYRAEVYNVRMADGYTLFKAGASPYTGYVYNCFNGTTPIPENKPALPQY